MQRPNQNGGEFLLGQSASPGDAEFHLFLSDVVEDSTGALPAKINLVSGSRLRSNTDLQRVWNGWCLRHDPTDVDVLVPDSKGR